VDGGFSRGGGDSGRRWWWLYTDSGGGGNGNGVGDRNRVGFVEPFQFLELVFNEVGVGLVAIPRPNELVQKQGLRE
jgi:hypothetical protein